MKLTEQRKRLMALAERAKEMRGELESLVEKAENGDDKATTALAEKRPEFLQIMAEGKALREQIEAAEEQERIQAYLAAPVADRKSKQGTSLVAHQRKSWGQLILESDAYRKAADQRQDMERVNVKAIYAVDPVQGGHFVIDQRVEAVDLPQRPRSVIDLINVAQTTSNSVEYIRMSSRDNQAAVVPEYTAGNFGLKPESNMAFALETAAVKTIATWVAASREILQDAPALRDTIDNELVEMLRIALENQILNGSGTGNNFTGILNTAGIQTRTQSATSPVGRGQVAADTAADTIRRALTDIRLAFYEPNGILMHPGDAENVELAKDSQGNYLNIYDSATARLWRVPVVESPIITAKTVLVGNFRLGATLWDRMQTDIMVGTPNDFFLRNAIAVLAELRAAFGVKRPTAFEKVTLA